MAICRTTQNRITAAINDERQKAMYKVRWVGIPLALVATVIYPVGVLAWWIIWFLCHQSATSCGDAIRLVGAAGEDRVENILARLSDGYTIFNQVQIPCESSVTGFREADFVVVGPNGVFIIENKDYTGRVVGGEHDPEWRLHKVGRGGTTYVKTARNPIKQVKVYVRMLASIFSARGIKAWITPLVSLSQDNSTDLINAGKVQVLQAGDLNDAIMGHQGNLTGESREQVLEVLEELRGNFSLVATHRNR